VPYSVLADVLARLPHENLVQLTDDEQTGTVSLSRVMDAIADADALIDGYLRGRYSLPLAIPVPALVRKLSVDLAIYHLYSRRLELVMPESMLERHKNATKALERIQGGIITLTAADKSDIPAPGEYRTQKTVSDRVFSKTVLNRF